MFSLLYSYEHVHIILYKLCVHLWTKAATKSAKLKIVPPFVSGYKCINYSRKLKKMLT